MRGGGSVGGDIPSRRLLGGVSQAQLGAGDLQDRAHRVHACGHGRGDSYRGGECDGATSSGDVVHLHTPGVTSRFNYVTPEIPLSPTTVKRCTIHSSHTQHHVPPYTRHCPFHRVRL